MMMMMIRYALDCFKSNAVMFISVVAMYLNFCHTSKGVVTQFYVVISASVLFTAVPDL